MNELSPTRRAKRKQIMTIVALLCGVFAAASIGVYLTTDAGPALGVTRKADIKTTSYIAPGDKVDPQDAWRGVSDTRLNTLETKLSALEAENRVLKARSGSNDSAPAPAKPAEQMSEAELDKRLADYEKSVEKPKDAYPAGSPSAPAASPIAMRSAPGMPPKQPPRRALPSSGKEAAIPAQAAGIITVRLNHQGDGAKAQVAPASEVSAKSAPRTTQNYLPAGMFGQAVLLSGLDAPTGGQAQSNPHPVLLQLLDLAVLPNRYRYDWAQCLITGAGYGDLSSERGYIRTESLACVAKDGKVLDVAIKGYIVGEDGKAGMRGRLVSKQGQVLGNALLAGVVAGIGTGLERASSIQSVSPLGATTTTKPGQEFQSGIGAGVGRALDRLANYYIQLAEKMFPVIEIDAARVVDIVLTQGVLVDVDLHND